jgi:ribosomal protein L39E
LFGCRMAKAIRSNRRVRQRDEVRRSS